MLLFSHRDSIQISGFQEAAGTCKAVAPTALTGDVCEQENLYPQKQRLATHIAYKIRSMHIVASV